MCAGSRTVTGVISAYIPVIGADRPRQVKAAVRIFLAGVTVCLGTGASRVHGTGPGAAGIGAVTVKTVITGCRVGRMCAGSRTVTGVIGTHIAVIGADRPRQVKAAVRIFLTGVALRLGARASRVHGTGPGAAGVGAVAENTVITGSGVVGMGTGSRTVTGVIGAHIAVIGARTTWRGEAAVRCLIAGVALRLRTGISRMD
jgi:hypothetical protein